MTAYLDVMYRSSSRKDRTTPVETSRGLHSFSLLPAGCLPISEAVSHRNKNAAVQN